MFEVSTSGGSDPRNMTSFTTESVGTLSALSNIITSRAWSPIVWERGKRAKANFKYSDFCALDFDDGRWRLHDAMQTLKQNDLSGLVGTTRSHQKQKDGSPAVDRFRLVMLWDGRITDARTYEQNMSRLVQFMPADRACKDAGRFFWPCATIHYAQSGGKLPWEPYAPPPTRVQSRTAQVDTELRRVPVWMRNELDRGIPPGQRNKTAFKFACHLRERGFSESDAEDILSLGIDIDTPELKSAISSAFRRT